ncbi:hypothetical protein SGLAM104S_04822 [Streptomyces glaucescens]
MSSSVVHGLPRAIEWSRLHSRSRRVRKSLPATTSARVRTHSANAGPPSRAAARRSRWRLTALSAMRASRSSSTAATRPASSTSATVSNASR